MASSERTGLTEAPRSRSPRVAAPLQVFASGPTDDGSEPEGLRALELADVINASGSDPSAVGPLAKTLKGAATRGDLERGASGRPARSPLAMCTCLRAMAQAEDLEAKVRLQEAGEWVGDANNNGS